MFGKKAADSGGRRQTRSRKVSQRMAVVDESSRQQAAQARLEALENDNADAGAADPFGLGLAADDDEEFVLGSDGEEAELNLPGSKKKKRAGAKRKTRGMLADARVPKTFARLLEDSGLDAAPASAGPNCLTAAAPPSARYAARKFCTVCGFESPYTCARCGSRFCSRRCYGVHTETRCLKFIS